MVWIALALLAFAAFVVYVVARQGRWSMVEWRYPTRQGPSYGQYLAQVEIVSALPWGPADAAGQQMGWAALHAALYDGTGFFVFSNGIVFTLFATFLLPLWSLSFATEGLGREREARNLLWVLTRPVVPAGDLSCQVFGTAAMVLAFEPGRLCRAVPFCRGAGTPGAGRLLARRGMGHAGVRGAVSPHGCALGRAPVLAILYAFFFETDRRQFARPPQAYEP